MPVRILVVEDHAPFRRFICAALQQAEFQTFEAADGLDGLQQAIALQPDLVLLDLNLPKMHGFDVAQQLRGVTTPPRLLFMSQEFSPAIVRQALSLGAQGYVSKISAATDLLPAIHAVLGGQRFVSRSVGLTESSEVRSPRRHEMVFCPDDAAVVVAFARWIEDALNTANAAMVLVTTPHRAQLWHELRTRGVDIDSALARGICGSLDADVLLDPARVLDTLDGLRATAVRAGNPQPRIAFCGERAGRLWAAGRTAEAVQLEQFGHELAQDIDILCAYPIPYSTADEPLARMCAEHTAVFVSAPLQRRV